MSAETSGPRTAYRELIIDLIPTIMDTKHLHALYLFALHIQGLEGRYKTAGQGEGDKPLEG